MDLAALHVSHWHSFQWDRTVIFLGGEVGIQAGPVLGECSRPRDYSLSISEQHKNFVQNVQCEGPRMLAPVVALVCTRLGDGQFLL